MTKTLSIFTAFVALTLAGGCATAPRSETARNTLRDDAQATVSRFEEQDPSLTDVLSRSAGYAVFPKVAKGGALVGGAYGHGVLYQNGRMAGYCNLEQASVGLQLGGQQYSELLVFKDQDALNRFKSGSYGLSGEATAVAAKNGTARQTEFRNGMAIFIMTGKGLMAEASLAGQKFKYEPMSDAGTDTRIDSRTEDRRDNRIDDRRDSR
jgi:lipid-binding SYLF domain-containing protein